jgi:hypothetical protein
LGIRGIALYNSRVRQSTATPCSCSLQSHSTLTARRKYRPQSCQFLLGLGEVTTPLQSPSVSQSVLFLFSLVCFTCFPSRSSQGPGYFRLGNGHAFHDSARTTRFDILPESVSESPSQLLPARSCHFRSRFQGQQISLPLSQLKTNKRTFHDSRPG